MSEGKAREFWLDLLSDHIHFGNVPEKVHVIEKSAYDKLQKENEALKAKIEKAIQGIREIAGIESGFTCYEPNDCKLEADSILKDLEAENEKD